MTSYLTQSEIDRLQETDLDRSTPFLICGVTQTQFSIARYYGGINYNGVYFAYLPTTDELIRADVRKLVHGWRYPPKKRKKKQAESGLFEANPPPLI